MKLIDSSEVYEEDGDKWGSELLRFRLPNIHRVQQGFREERRSLAKTVEIEYSIGGTTR